MAESKRLSIGSLRVLIAIILGLIAIASLLVGWIKNDALEGQIDVTQDKRLFEVEEMAECNKDEINRIKVKAAEELATKKAIFESLTRIEATQSSQGQSIGRMEIDLATTKTKVENLERAE